MNINIADPDFCSKGMTLVIKTQPLTRVPDQRIEKSGATTTFVDFPLQAGSQTTTFVLIIMLL